MLSPKTPEKIHHEISDMLSKGVSYIDALIEYAKRNDLEIESIADIVKKSPILKEKVRTEAQNINMIKKENETDDGIISKLCE
jgi:hypothetical protein